MESFQHQQIQKGQPQGKIKTRQVDQIQQVMEVSRSVLYKNTKLEHILLKF